MRKERNNNRTTSHKNTGPGKESLEGIMTRLDKDPSFRQGVIQVVSRHLNGKKSESIVGGLGYGYEKTLKVFSDERETFGGKNTAPAPLEYFVSGLNFSMLSTGGTWLAKMGMHLSSYSISAKAYFNRAGLYIGGDPSFGRIVMEVHTEGKATPREVKAFIRKTSEHCVPFRTLKKATRMELTVFHNGRKI